MGIVGFKPDASAALRSAQRPSAAAASGLSASELEKALRDLHALKGNIGAIDGFDPFNNVGITEVKLDGATVRRVEEPIGHGLTSLGFEVTYTDPAAQSRLEPLLRQTADNLKVPLVSSER